MDYVRDYGNEGSGDHIMIVKVSPADAVSVPSDSQFMKLRTCKYEVVAETEWTDELRNPLYSSEGSDYELPQDEHDEYDDWYDDIYDDESASEEDILAAQDDSASDKINFMKQLKNLISKHRDG